MGPAPPQASASPAPDADADYVLHFFPFSLYSLMSRFALVLGRGASGPPPPPDPPPLPPRIAVVLTNIQLPFVAHLTESYLRTVNPKGQVPALTGAALPAPLTDSLDISYWLCSVYPALLPAAHEAVIRRLLAQLHDIVGLSLTITDPQARAEGYPYPYVDDLLARSDISPEYRRALEFKRAYHREHQEFVLDDESVRVAEDKARRFFAGLAELLLPPAGDGAGDEEDPASLADAPWLFGDAPTVLDAHAVPFVARMLDVGRDALVPARVAAYARRVMARPEWQAVTHGRPTMWHPSMGRVHLMEQI